MTTISPPLVLPAGPVLNDETTRVCNDGSILRASPLVRITDNLAERNDVLSGRHANRPLPKPLSPMAAGLKPPTAPARMTPPRVFTAIGMTDRQAVNASGVPAELLTQTGTSFDANHIQGDLGNQFSHAATAEIVSSAVQAAGLGQLAGTLAGSALFALKENFYDLHASTGDYVVTHELYRTARANGTGESISATAFGDGAAFVSFRAAF